MLKTKDHKTTLTEDISASVKVKISKPEPDALRHIYGEPVRTDTQGQEYFIIPAHKAQYTREVFPKYIVSPEFLPDEEIDKLKNKSKDINAEQSIKQNDSEEKTVVKKRGNPNWGKKPEIMEDEEDAINA